jgi:hypothetical protein
MLEPPESGEIDGFGQAQHEGDDAFNIAALIVADPKNAAVWTILARQVEPVKLGLFGLVRPSLG